MDSAPDVNPGQADLQSEISALRAELEAVKRRDAEFRAHMVREFLDRGERNTYVHVLHEERAQLIRREQESFMDLEVLTGKLEAALAKAEALEAEVSRIRRSWSWRLTAPLRAAALSFGRPAPGAVPSPQQAQTPVAPAIFTYYLHTSPFRIYRGKTFTLRGWAWPGDGRAITGVRINLGGRLTEGRHGLEEPEVIARYGPQPSNPRPGFEITFETPPGRHSLSLEAQIEGADWRWIMRTSVWCEPVAP